MCARVNQNGNKVNKENAAPIRQRHVPQPSRRGRELARGDGDLLAEEGVRGVVVTVFYDDRRYMVRQVNVAGSDLALMGAKLLQLATED